MILTVDPVGGGLDRNWAGVNAIEQVELFKHPEHLEQTKAGRGGVGGSSSIVIATEDDVLLYSKPTKPRTNNAAEARCAQAMHSLEQYRGRLLTEEEKGEIFMRWYEQIKDAGLDRGPWEMYEDELYQAYENVTAPLGGNPLEPAFASAVAVPIPAIADKLLTTEKQKRLAALCQEAQRVVGPEKKFYLSCNTVKQKFTPLASADTKTIWNMFNMLVRREILKRPEKGTAHSKTGQGRAARFLYLPPLEDN